MDSLDAVLILLVFVLKALDEIRLDGDHLLEFVVSDTQIFDYTVLF